MKVNVLFRYLPIAVAVFASTFWESLSAAAERPTITSIRVTSSNVVVSTRVPAGVRRVTLEGRTRLGAGSWSPRAVVRLSGAAQEEVVFRLARAEALALLRVRADATEPLPREFYSGTNSFAGSPGGQFDSRAALDATGQGPAPGAAPPEATSREVQESDIWRINGDTLYFFNQLRGLQIIDLSTIDRPVIKGVLNLPAAGEQMYLLGNDHVVLLARGGCYNESSQSQLVIVNVAGGNPRIVKELSVPGYIQESRLVGSALYVASQVYQRVPNNANSVWEYGTVVSAIDLANPAEPVSRESLWYSGYGHVISATDRYLFVATQDINNWWQSIVRVIDISDPTGVMHGYASIRTAGRVIDKFKMNYDGRTFSVISERSDGRLITKLETFNLPDPRAAGPAGVTKLGEVELGRNERLMGTRFDGNKVYIVTFFQIDPLWIVDLTDPTNPRITGELEIPGWSTYIQPMGDRLLAVGIETNRVAVSLFDVHDPTHPALLSKVRLGQNYSWSEANSDEKALSVLPDAGLVLLPFQGSGSNAVQLIDFDTDKLTLRGVIQHEFSPRRATLHNGRIVSLSSHQLLTVDPTDRDRPVVTSQTELAWSVQRLHLQWPFLIEITTGYYWGSASTIQLRVARAETPYEILTTLNLTNLPIVGSTVKDGRLYLAQSSSQYYYPIEVPVLNGTNIDLSLVTNFLVTAVNLASLPALQVLGTTGIAVGQSGAQNVEAVWPRPDLLVWVGGGYSYYFYDIMPLRGAPVSTDMAVGRLWWPWWGGSSGDRLWAFDVKGAAAPKFVSEVNLSTTNGNRWSFSKPLTADGNVYLSHSSSELIAVPANTDPSAPDKPIIIETWVQRYFLNVIDYADATTPTVRPPVNIPGSLIGLADNGALLFTQGSQYNPSNNWVESIEASAYDGVSAHLVSSFLLPNAWPHPVITQGRHLFLGKSGYTTSTNVGPHSLETWLLSDTGQFTRTGSVPLKQPASNLRSLGSLLVAQETDSALALFDSSAPSALRALQEQRPSFCWWFDLNLADGDINHGLYIPLNDYGVWKVQP